MEEWQVTLDLTGDDQEENLSLLFSPLFDTEEEADGWYRSLSISNDVKRINKGIDAIMIYWVNGRMEDAYLL